MTPRLAPPESFQDTNNPGMSQTAPLNDRKPENVRCDPEAMCSLGDHLPLMLGNSREDVDGELVSLREVAYNELNLVLHQVGYEGYGPG